MKSAALGIALMSIVDSAALFVVACTQPALDLRGVPATGVATPPGVFAPRAWTGLDLLLGGWAGLAAAEPAWLANPLLILAWLALGLRRWRVALALAVGALALAASALTRETITVLAAQETTPFLVEQVRLGAYFWLASVGVATLGSAVGWFFARRTTPIPLHLPS